jgi:ElaB/YqjD/DUF883 family membrane-anchored ribosome-binding protein
MNMTETAEPQSAEIKQSGRMESALATARGATNDVLHETGKIAERAGKAIEANPLAVVAGGIAIGLAAGALLPKTKRETELLGSVGKRLTGVAAGAAEAARDAAKAELGSLPLSKDAAKAQVSKLIDQVAKAVSSAGEAALNGSPVTAAEIKPAKKSN